jgi:hypothetical protein
MSSDEKAGIQASTSGHPRGFMGRRFFMRHASLDWDLDLDWN